MHEQHARVERARRAVERDQERVERREQRKRISSRWWGSIWSDGTSSRRWHAISTTTRPAEADQQPVRAGHVRDRVGEYSGSRPAVIAKWRSTAYSGQHAHEREHEERQVLRDVALGELHATTRAGTPRRRSRCPRAAPATRAGGRGRRGGRRHPGHRERGGEQEPDEIPLAQTARRRGPCAHQSGAPNSRS